MKTKNRALLLLFLVVGTLFLGCGSQYKVTEGKLDNGLTYMILPNKKPENRVVFYLAVRTGSVNEHEDEQGIAHFLEHMAFNGTKSYPKERLVNYLKEQFGSSFGADINAHTSFDETVFKLTIPMDANNPGAVDEVLLLLREWCDEMALPQEQIEREKGVVLEEWRLGLNAYNRIGNEQLKLLLSDTIYGKRLPIGTDAHIKSFTRDMVANYYNRYYIAPNIAVIVVGDFSSTKDMEQSIKTHFATLRSEGEISKPQYSTIPAKTAQNSPMIAMQSDPELSDFDMTFSWRFLGDVAIRTKDEVRSSLIENFIGYMINERLRSISSSSDGIVFNGDTGFARLGYDQRFLQIELNFHEKNIDKAYLLFLEFVEQLERDGFYASELDYAKKDYEAIYKQYAAEAELLPSNNYAATLSSAFIHGSKFFTYPEYYKLFNQLSKQITVDEVNRYLAKILQDTLAYQFISMPTVDPMPTEEGFTKLYQQFDKTAVEAYPERTFSGDYYGDIPQSKATIDTEETYAENIMHWQLSNGINVYLRPSKNSDSIVNFLALAPGGLNELPIAELYSAKFSLPYTNEAGYGEFDKDDLAHLNNGKYLSLSPILKNYFHGFSGLAAVQDLDSLFKFLYLQSYVGARSDEKIFNQLKDQFWQNFMGYSNTPDEAFDRISSRVLYGEERNPYYSGVMESEDFDNLSFQDVVKNYQYFFNNKTLSQSDYFFTGAIDPATFKKLILKYLGGLPNEEKASVPIAQLEPKVPLAPRANRELKVEKGVDNKAAVMVTYQFDMPYDAQNSFNWEMLRELLSNRLLEVIRENLGIIYSPWVYVSRLDQSDRVQLYIVNNTDPIYTDKLVELIDDEFNYVLTGKMSDVEYQRALSVVLEQRARSKERDSYWLSLISTAVQYDGSLQNIDDYLVDNKKTFNQKELEELFFKKLFNNYSRSVAIQVPEQ